MQWHQRCLQPKLLQPERSCTAWTPLTCWLEDGGRVYNLPTSVLSMLRRHETAHLFAVCVKASVMSGGGRGSRVGAKQRHCPHLCACVCPNQRAMLALDITPPG